MLLEACQSVLSEHPVRAACQPQRVLLTLCCNWHGSSLSSGITVITASPWGDFSCQRAVSVRSKVRKSSTSSPPGPGRTIMHVLFSRPHLPLRAWSSRVTGSYMLKYWSLTRLKMHKKNRFTTPIGDTGNGWTLLHEAKWSRRVSKSAQPDPFLNLSVFSFAASLQISNAWNVARWGRWGRKCRSHQWELYGVLEWAHSVSECSAACVFSPAIARKLHPRLLAHRWLRPPEASWFY